MEPPAESPSLSVVRLDWRWPADVATTSMVQSVSRSTLSSLSLLLKRQHEKGGQQ